MIKMVIGVRDELGVVCGLCMAIENRLLSRLSAKKPIIVD